MSRSDISGQYDPTLIEEKWYRFWEENGYFATEDDSGREPYTIMMPPPNITGMLHMGHGLQDTVQDTLTRYYRMQGREALWLPGTDHAGIATQNVVEKKLIKTEGKDRHGYGREEFINRVWEWKQEYGDIISRQKRKLGDSADWKRERFTMDEGLSKAVRAAFVKLYEKGLVYRGQYIVNWCPKDHTAISDEEVTHKEQQGKLWYFRYPVEGSDEYVVIATTRPETMLGDTALATHPDDDRYRHLYGKQIRLPLADRLIPIIRDAYVDPEFGTGLVKVTPAHDPNDFEMGQRHKLPRIMVIDEQGRMAGDIPEKYIGLDRYDARNQIVQDMDAAGLLEKIVEHTHSVGHCQRCDTVIEPFLSTQWFVRMKPLAEPALKAVDDGLITFYPARWENVYRRWLEEIRDWCISRQLWWGHQIPVWYCQDCGAEIVSETEPSSCTKCGGNHLVQDEDVLDTWFSSWLWPFSTLGWPQETKALEKFYPTDVLVSGYDIIFFWIARMIMAGLEFTGKVPFQHVYITGMIRDELGRWMSKSLGNGINPLDMVQQYGADAVRYSLIVLNTEGQDIKLAPTRFEMGRNFANKLWNAFRFISIQDWEMLKSGGKKIEPQPVQLTDRWILSRLEGTLAAVEDAFTRYKINEALMSVYDFVWHDLCDWYLELAKPRLYSDKDPEDRKQLLQNLIHVFDQSVRMLHPFMPFITEEIWQYIHERLSEMGYHKPEPFTIMKQPYPQQRGRYLDEALNQRFEVIKSTVTAIRNIRAEQNIPPSKEVEVIIRTEAGTEPELSADSTGYIVSLARLSGLRFDHDRPELASVAVVSNFEVVIPLADLIDPEKEVARLTREKEKLEKYIAVQQKKLANENFTSRAPDQVVAGERKKLAEQEAALSKILESLSRFQS